MWNTEKIKGKDGKKYTIVAFERAGGCTLFKNSPILPNLIGNYRTIEELKEHNPNIF